MRSDEQNPRISFKLTDRDVSTLERIGREPRKAMLFAWNKSEEEMLRLSNREVAARLRVASRAEVAQRAIRSFLNDFGMKLPCRTPLQEFTEQLRAGAIVIHGNREFDFLIQAYKHRLTSARSHLELLRGFEKVREQSMQVPLTPWEYVLFRLLARGMALGPSELGKMVIQDYVLGYASWEELRKSNY